MKVIVAGLSKTGTKSLATALRILGYRVCDTEQHWSHHMEIWNKYYEDKTPPDYVSMYEGFDAVTDLPSCFFFDDIFKAFPDSKVVLSVRDSEQAWRDSMDKTFDIFSSTFNQWWLVLVRYLTPTGRTWHKFSLLSLDFLDKVDYTAHNDKAKSVVPSQQLLVFNLKNGWKPLCDFLGKEIPNVPFPRRNVGSSYIPDMINKSPTLKRAFWELVVLFAVLFAFVAIILFLMIN